MTLELSNKLPVVVAVRRSAVGDGVIVWATPHAGRGAVRGNIHRHVGRLEQVVQENPILDG